MRGAAFIQVKGVKIFLLRFLSLKDKHLYHLYHCAIYSRGAT